MLDADADDGCASADGARGSDLAFDWGVATIKAISGVSDPRNLATIAAYATVVYSVLAAVKHRNSAGSTHTRQLD